MEANEASPAGLLQPGQIIKPMIDKEHVCELVKSLYGLNVTEIKEINSYDDRNFYVKVEENHSNSNLKELWPHGYVLKILNSMDTKNPALVEAQNEMMLYLKDHELNVPFPVLNLQGEIMRKHSICNDNKDPTENMVRLLTFIPGKTLYEVPYTTQLFFECGAYIANLNNILKDFKNAELEKRNFIWMLSSTPELEKFSYVIKDEKRSKLIIEVLSTWKERVQPVLHKLDKGIIHGDFNEQNILVEADENGCNHIKGILDFGDISLSPYLFEVAISIMYLMIEVTAIPPNDVGGHVLAGYYTKRKLTDVEWSIIKVCVAARFAQSLVMGAYSYAQDPGNEYLLVTAAKGWDVLSEFWYRPEEKIISRWKSIMETYSTKI